MKIKKNTKKISAWFLWQKKWFSYKKTYHKELGSLRCSRNFLNKYWFYTHSTKTCGPQIFQIKILNNQNPKNGPNVGFVQRSIRNKVIPAFTQLHGQFINVEGKSKAFE